MICYAIGEPEFEASNWYRDIVDGLLYEKKQKRFTLTFLATLSELDALTVERDDFVFVIGNDSEWISETTAKLSERFGSRVIVLGNHERRYHGTYSVVTSDISSNVKLLCEYLISLGKKHIVMYGINPASVSDSYKADVFRSVMGEGAQLVYNDGSLSGCFESFERVTPVADAVICVNVYAAISLLGHLNGRSIYVTALGTGLLAEFIKPSVTHVESDYRAFAAAGLELARLLVKNESISSLTVYIKGRFKAGESTECSPYHNNASLSPSGATRGDTRFYSDPEVMEMLAIEEMLSHLGRDDMDMITDILDGKTYQAIADERFISEGTVKYKMKMLCDICAVSGRAELVALLSKYLK